MYCEEFHDERLLYQVMKAIHFAYYETLNIMIPRKSRKFPRSPRQKYKQKRIISPNNDLPHTAKELEEYEKKHRK